MKDEFEYKFDILMWELKSLQDSIRSYDSLLFHIKGWAITIFSAFLFFAAKENQEIYTIFGSFGVIFFWMLDSIYKSIQRGFIARFNKVEHILRSGDFSQAIEKRSFKKIYVPDFSGKNTVRDYGKKTSIIKSALFVHTMILYVSMLFILTVVFCWLHWNT